MSYEKMYPKISIITPSYNQGEFIERTILSVLNQNYPNLEYIIIDGGSTDHSVDIIKKYADKITYWISEKDKGTYDANNKALEKITGDFWCVVNSDDVLLPNAIEKIVNIIHDNPSHKWFAGTVKYIDENDLVIRQQVPVKPAPIEGYTFLQSCWILHPGVFLHKDIIAQIGLFEKYHSMDLNYWLRMEKQGYFPFIVEEPIAALRMHKDCKSIDVVKAHEETLKVCTDFIKTNNLKDRKAIQIKIKKDAFQYYRMKLNQDLISNNKIESLVSLKKITILSSNALFEKWYWGAIKRILFGVKEGDPLLGEFSLEENKANWS